MPPGDAPSPGATSKNRIDHHSPSAGFARMIERAAAGAGLEIKAHPHMLRHACGYALANKGHDTRAIQAGLAIGRSRAPRRSPNRFKDFWRD
jgi:integrase